MSLTGDLWDGTALEIGFQVSLSRHMDFNYLHLYHVYGIFDFGSVLLVETILGVLCSCLYFIKRSLIYPLIVHIPLSVLDLAADSQLWPGIIHIEKTCTCIKLFLCHRSYSSLLWGVASAVGSWHLTFMHGCIFDHRVWAKRHWCCRPFFPNLWTL